MAAMHQQDREALCVILGVTDLPKEVTDIYARIQRGWSRIRSGAMSVEMLMVIADQSGFLKPPEEVKSRFGNVRQGQQIYWQPSPYDEEIVTFVRLIEPLSEGVAEIITALDPDHPRRVPEARLSLTPRATVAAASPEEDDDEDDVAGDVSPAEDESAQTESAMSMVDRLREEYPNNTEMEVAVPGESPFSAVAKGVGSGKFEGRIKVEDKATGQQRWVSVDHVMKAASA